MPIAQERRVAVKGVYHLPPWPALGVCALICALLVPATIFSRGHPHAPGMADRPHGHLKISSAAENDGQVTFATLPEVVAPAFQRGAALGLLPQTLCYRLETAASPPPSLCLSPPEQPPRSVTVKGCSNGEALDQPSF